jgi:hypothetical protein
MTKIKDLKSKPENNLNIIEILELICPEKKTKYIETLLRLMKKTKNFDNYIVDIKEMFTKRLNISSSKLEKFTNFQMFLMWDFLEAFDIDDLVEYQKFCDFNERGLIQSNDLSKYSSFDEIISVTSIAELRLQEKELEKQIKVIYTNEEWTVIRPLTGNSSMKYGSGTKWCTASTKNPDYFFRYSKRGILLYMINKKTGLKVACFKSLDDEHEFSFWNQVDTRIDSIESGLPLFIIDIIRDEVTNNPVSNMSLLSDEEKKIQEDLLGYRLNKYSASEIQPQEMDMDISNLYDSFDSVSINERRLTPPMPEDMDLTVADVPRNFG